MMKFTPSTSLLTGVLVSVLVCGLSTAGCLEEAKSGSDAEVEGAPADSVVDRPDTTGPLSCATLKLDVLLVVDQSISTCAEQNALSVALSTFATAMKTSGADVQFAATGMDTYCDPGAMGEAGFRASQGALSTRSASEFPPGCYIQSHEVCGEDTDCGPAGEFVCKDEIQEQCIQNPNGSVNTGCRALCVDDASCVARYGPQTECLSPAGAGKKDSGCVITPGPGCPSSFGPVVSGANPTTVGCLGVPGVYSYKCFKYEEGFKAAWLALGPGGTTSKVAGSDFPRQDAQLAIVFSSNDDDCSTAGDAAWEAGEYENCAFEADTNNGGPLLPVAKVLADLQSLKSDPSLVSVVTVVGDSLADTEAQREADRQAYRASKTSVVGCHKKTTICDGPLGPEKWGGRYNALATAMGAQGISENACGEAPFRSALERLETLVTATHEQACNP